MVKFYFLYVKTHNITGLKYLGQTTHNPYRYKGSGKIWLKHLSFFGNCVSTQVVGRFTKIEDLREEGLRLSKLWNIVESDEWANLIVESGYGIIGRKHTESEKEAQRQFMLRDNPFKGKKHSEKTKQFISQLNKGKCRLSEEARKQRSIRWKMNNPAKRGKEFHSCFGKRWYNDGQKEFKIIEKTNLPQNWVKGRLQFLTCSKETPEEMPSEPFTAKFGIVANSDFTANSTVVTLGSNVSLNTSALSVSGAVLNSTSFTGQANSALYVGSIPAASVVTAASLAANLSSYEPRASLTADVSTVLVSYSGAVNAGSLASPSSGFYSNSTVRAYFGNTAGYFQFPAGSASLSGSDSFGNLTLTTTSLSFTVGANLSPSFTANSTGVYHTGIVGVDSVQANSISIGSGTVTANSTSLSVNGAVASAKVGIQGVSNSSYTLVPSDSGKALWVSNSSVTTVTVSNSLPVGFRCLLIQGSANVQIANSAGVSLLSRTGAYKLTAQYSSASVIVPFAGSAVIDGSI